MVIVIVVIIIVIITNVIFTKSSRSKIVRPRDINPPIVVSTQMHSCEDNGVAATLWMPNVWWSRDAPKQRPRQCKHAYPCIRPALFSCHSSSQLVARASMVRCLPHFGVIAGGFSPCG